MVPTQPTSRRSEPTPRVTQPGFLDIRTVQQKVALGRMHAAGWDVGGQKARRRLFGGRLSGAERNEVSYRLDAPAGAGLGASAAQTLLWLTLVKTMVANVSDRQDLAERAWRIKRARCLGGKQDQYGCAVGGINYMTFGATTTVAPLRLGLPLIGELEGRLSLFYTGDSRNSGGIHERVWKRFESGDAEVVKALRDLRRIAGEQREALPVGDLDAFGRLINENWNCQKKLDVSVTTARLDRLVDVARDSGALGVKATGAGGGGCLLCLAETGAGGGLTEAMREAGAKLIPFHFDWYGLHLTKV